MLTVDRHRIIEQFTGIYLRVLVDGVDVTAQCFAADNETGWALVHKTDDAGRPYLDRTTGKAAADVLIGDVQFVRRADRDPYGC